MNDATVPDTTDESLAARIDAAVLGVDGVIAVYPTRPTLASIGGVVRSAVETRGLDGARTQVVPDGVRVSIGTDARSAAPEVVRAVQTAIAVVLEDVGHPAERLEVRVARIG